MAYKFQSGDAILSGALLQEGNVEIEQGFQLIIGNAKLTEAELEQFAEEVEKARETQRIAQERGLTGWIAEPDPWWAFGDMNTPEQRGEPIEILLNEATNQKFISNLYLATEPLKQDEELAAIFSTNMEEIQDLYISLPCGMRNMTDTIDTVNSINTNLKNKSNVVDINVKNLNIQDKNITDEVKNMLLNNIKQSMPETTDINDVNFIDYKK